MIWNNITPNQLIGVDDLIALSPYIVYHPDDVQYRALSRILRDLRFSRMVRYGVANDTLLRQDIVGDSYADFSARP